MNSMNQGLFTNYSQALSQCRITVPAVDFEERNVWCFTRDKPKSQTCDNAEKQDITKIRAREANKK